MRSTQLERHWDARWTRAEQDEAVRQADQQAAQARIDIDAAIRAVEAATEGYSDAMKWTVSVRSWRDDARAVASRDSHPTPKEGR